MFRKQAYLFSMLIPICIAALLASTALGAVQISAADMVAAIRHWLQGQPPANIREGVFLQLRLPRVLLCACTGAVLAVSGLLMQGLSRNPIVEPGLVGTSSGAAFGASLVFVLSTGWNATIKSMAGPLLVPIFAFCGGLLATWLVYVLASRRGHVPVVTLLLVGMAVNAVFMSGTGFMTYIARDPQARSITFWNLGTFSGASWTQVMVLGSVSLVIFLVCMRYARHLNALLLGEEEAGYLGIDTASVKRVILVLNTAMVALATAFVGVISFIGLITPHILRLMTGSDNRTLMPASMILGATIMLVSDLASRMLVAPAEMPVGIITALVGAPFFIIMLRTLQAIPEYE